MSHHACLLWCGRYYSIYGRRPECPLTRRYGEGWQLSHTVAFDRLPHLISQHLHKQLLQQLGSQRFVEVARTFVFTSARADTHKQSRRMQMFDQMARSNFEVHMRTTMGAQEKCIDIQLAVDMMHYANVPGAYDCAVLLSGDKDFMPAMSRIRQGGKAVALCSMRNCCSQDMISPSAHVRTSLYFLLIPPMYTALSVAPCHVVHRAVLCSIVRRGTGTAQYSTSYGSAWQTS